MSRPRKPYGPNPPGRLMGTMIKVLAAELSDQGRLSRGKRYWADDAVVDIVVGHGAVTAEIQGSRSQPYVVTIEATSGSGVPSRREVWAQCTCPDDTGTGVDLCKHAVAAMFTLADEVSIDPELIDRWRSGRRLAFDRGESAAPVDDDTPGDGTTDGGTIDDDAVGGDSSDHDSSDPDLGEEAPAGSADVAALRFGRRDQPANDGDEVDDDADGSEGGAVADVVELHPHRRADTDVIAGLLRAPAGTSPPEFPEPTELHHGPIRNRLLAEILDDALDHLAIRWE